MRVSRHLFAFAILLPVGLIGAPSPANAQDTSRPGDTRTPGGNTADSKSTSGRVPKDYLIVNPCKSAHPPSYCNAKN